MFRGPPAPRNGLLVPTSGVAVMGIDSMPRPCASGSEPFRKSTAKLGTQGLVKLGWLIRHCIFNFSPMERSGYPLVYCCFSATFVYVRSKASGGRESVGQAVADGPKSC